MIAAGFILAVLYLLFATEFSTADHVPPRFIRGNPECDELAPTGRDWQQLSIRPVRSGDYGAGSLVIRVEVYQDGDRERIDWTANEAVAGVFVRGGNGGNLYQYDPPSSDVRGDDGLHAPRNRQNGRYHNPTRLLFCTSSASSTPTPQRTPTLRPTTTATPVNSPPIGVSFLPLAPYQSVAGEPNNRCGAAHPITPNVVYNFLPDDSDDWYHFELTDAGNLIVELSNFTPVAGQIAAYKGDSCATSRLLDNNGDFATAKMLELGPQTAGSYFLYVGTDGPFSTTPYRLHVQLQQP